MISINILNDFNIELSYKKQLIDNCIKEMNASEISKAEILVKECNNKNFIGC